MNAEFTAAGAHVLGISADSIASHEKFATKYSLTMPLLADLGSLVCQSYGVWVDKINYGKTYKGIERTTFVIGPDGTIATVFSKVKVEGHAEAVLEAVKALG